MSVEKLFFDALGVNIKIDDSEYFEQFREFATQLNLYLGVPPVREQKSNNSYLKAIVWETEKYSIFLNYSGYTKNMGLFLEVKGYIGSMTVARFINSLDKTWKWSLTRADVALDFKGKTIFDKLKDKLILYSKVKGIEYLNTHGDWINCVKGRTLYSGSKKSDVQFRLYEKSQEQWEKGNASYPEDMVRMEVQIRTTKRQRAHITELTPANVLSINRNVSGFYSELVSTAIEPMYIPKAPVKSDAEKLNYAIDQYYAIMDRIITDVGFKGLLELVIKRFKLNKKKRRQSSNEVQREVQT